MSVQVLVRSGSLPLFRCPLSRCRRSPVRGPVADSPCASAFPHACRSLLLPAIDGYLGATFTPQPSCRSVAARTVALTTRTTRRPSTGRLGGSWGVSPRPSGTRRSGTALGAFVWDLVGPAPAGQSVAPDIRRGGGWLRTGPRRYTGVVYLSTIPKPLVC